MVFSFLLRCASTFIGAFIPSFFTFKSIARPNQRAQIYWLKYWAVYGSSLAIECALDFFLISYIIPGFDLARLAFILYAINPVTNGAQVLFDNGLKPFFVRNERKIDAIGANVSASIKNRLAHVVNRASTTLLSIASSTVPSLLIEIAAGPPEPLRTTAYHDQNDDVLQPTYPLIREVKEEPIEWEEEDVEILDVAPPRRTTRNRSANPSVPTTSSHTRRVDALPPPLFSFEEEESNGEEEKENSGEGDIDYTPINVPKKRGRSTTTKRGRGRGKKVVSDD